MNSGAVGTDLTFDQAYAIIQRIGKDIGVLYKRGDKLARDVFERYRDWYAHEGEAFNKWSTGQTTEATMPDTRRRRAVVSAIKTYLQRDLMLHERNELAGKKGHLVEAEPDSNVVRVHVRRALNS